MSLLNDVSLGRGGGGLHHNDLGAGGGGADEVKTRFRTREGWYRLMKHSEYTRPNRVGGYANSATPTGSNSSAPVRVSFPGRARSSAGNSGGCNGVDHQQQQQHAHSSSNTGSLSNHSSSGSEAGGVSGGEPGDRIAFNYGRELYVYPYRGIRKAADLNKPIDKRIYKGTLPTCHDFGAMRDDDSDEVIPLLVGFSLGQIQLVDPVRKELSKLYNEERLMEKSRATCIKWIPGSPNYFLVSYSSGSMYIFNHELTCAPTPPSYQLFKQGPAPPGAQAHHSGAHSHCAYAIYTCKTKTTRNPLYKWTVGQPGTPVNEFAFSPCGHFLATVSQDGYLRVFNYDAMELVGTARSYFGGLLCVSWSPDGKYLVCGGEDDLVTVYSVVEKRVVARGKGHKSWVSQIRFDPYLVHFRGGDAIPDGLDFSGSEEEDDEVIGSGSHGHSHAHEHHRGQQQQHSMMHKYQHHHQHQHHHHQQQHQQHQQPLLNGGGGRSGVSKSSTNFHDASNAGKQVTRYRVGSVGEDTLLCLWDLTEEVLTQVTSSVAASSNGGTAASDKASLDSATGNGNTLSSSASSPPATAATAANDTASTVTTTTKSSRGGDSGIVDGGGGGAHNSASSASSVTSSTTSLTQRLASLNFNKEHKRNFSLGRSSHSQSDKSSSDKSSGANGRAAAAATLPPGVSPEYVKLGSAQCPRINEVPVVEPLVVKKIAQDRLTALVFREECFVVACQDGYVYTWSRPGRVTGGYSLNMMCPGSPPQNSTSIGVGTGGGGAVGGSGTIV